MRILHLLVIGALVFAAAYVYRIKMESTDRAPSGCCGCMRKYASSVTPSRCCARNGPSSTRRCGLQGLAERHLPLKPITATQYDSLKNLPERPPNFTDRATRSDRRDDRGHRRRAAVTGSVPAPEDRQ
jgi:hypothetical protein